MSSNVFPSAVGHGNLPNGVFSPDIFSTKVLKFFKTISVVGSLTTTDFEGEIRNQGDTVRILKQPEVTVRDYNRGTKVQPQDLEDNQITMSISEGKYYSFKMDDVEKAQQHVRFEDLAADAGAWKLRDTFDTDVLSNMHTNATVPTGVGTAGSPVDIGFGAGNEFSAADLISRFATSLDENDIPDMGRWFCASPAFYEQLRREDSKYVDAGVMGDSKSMIRDPNMVMGNMHGFTLFKSNNQPLSSSSDITVLAGHSSSTATATQLLTAETFRNPEEFGDIFRGLLVYGRKVIRPEALMTGFVTLGDQAS